MPTPRPYFRFDRCNLQQRPLCALITWAAVVVCGVSGLISADDVDMRLEREVAEFVAELRSPLRSERVRAEQALMKLGPQILGLLPAPDETPDQATRMAVRQIRVRLERIAAEQSVKPTRVTLRGTLSVAEAAAHIERQTGNRVDVERLSAPLRAQVFDVDWHDDPFWECVSALCEEASFSWETATNDAAIRLVGRADDAEPDAAADNSQAFRVAIESLSRRRGTLRASVSLTAEPRLRPLFVRVADVDFVAESDGESLPLFSPQAVTELPMTTRGPARFSVLFTAADEANLAKITVRGRATVHVAAAPTEVRFEDLSGQRIAYQRCGGVSVTLKRAELVHAPDGEDDLVVRLAVAYDSGGPEFESHRTWIYHNDVRLESADGTRIAPETNFDINRTADGSVELEYRFSGISAATRRDWQLVYVAPMLLVDVPVEFEFAGMPVGASSDE